jgi:hypothetical protein
MTPMNQQPNARVGIGFTRHCFTCKKNKNASGGKINRRTQMWSCMSCQEELDLKWKSGPPPAIGWWPTKVTQIPRRNWNGAYRWWDGESWSYAAFEHESAKKAAEWAAKTDRTTSKWMLWSEWPKK